MRLPAPHFEHRAESQVLSTEHQVPSISYKVPSSSYKVASTLYEVRSTAYNDWVLRPESRASTGATGPSPRLNWTLAADGCNVLIVRGKGFG